MGDDDAGWQSMHMFKNHASDRGVADALLELYMNAVDAEQEYATANAVPFQMPTIEVPQPHPGPGRHNNIDRHHQPVRFRDPPSTLFFGATGRR